MLNNLRNHVAAVGKGHVEIALSTTATGHDVPGRDDGREARAGDRRLEGRWCDRFLICQNTLDERKIDWHGLWRDRGGHRAERRRRSGAAANDGLYLRSSMTRVLSRVLGVLAPACTGIVGVLPPACAGELVPVPAGHEADLRFFAADGGMAAFRRMAEADLTLWVAGNQFFAMPKVIGDFQALHPGMSVGLMTLPPGMILQAIQAHGWSFWDARLVLQPDVFATVSTEQLRDTGEIVSRGCRERAGAGHRVAIRAGRLRSGSICGRGAE